MFGKKKIILPTRHFLHAKPCYNHYYQGICAGHNIVEHHASTIGHTLHAAA